jgi:hypothetical protein
MAKENPLDREEEWRDIVRSMRDQGGAYFEALGRFIDNYSDAEYAIYDYLVSLTGLDFNSANAILSGTRVDAAISFIRRLHAARRVEISVEVEDVLVHLATLNTARNELVHFGTYFDSDRWRVVSTAAKAHLPEKAKEWRISTNTLYDMADDAEKAALTLLAILKPSLKRRTDWKDALSRAWLYKSAPIPAPKEKSLSRADARKSKARKRPPRS